MGFWNTPVFRKALRPRIIELLVHVAVSRTIYLACSVLGALIAKDKFFNHDIPMPDPIALWAMIKASAVNYGDIGWYAQIANRGYDFSTYTHPIQANWAFFPLFPMIMRVVTMPSVMFALPQLVFAASVLMLYAFLKTAVDQRTARAATLLMIYFPFSYVVSQFRPEAFLLFLSVSAVLAAQQRQRWLSGGAGLLAGFAKPNAFLGAILLLRYFPGLMQRRPRLTSISGLAMLAAPGVGVLAMCWIMQKKTYDPLAWAKVQGAWGAEFIGTPARELASLFSHPLLVGRGGWDPLLLNWLIFAGLLTAVGVLVWKRKWDWAAYAFTYAMLSFSNVAVFVMGKHMTTCFPLFVGLAMLAAGRTRLTALLILFAAGLVTMSLFNGAGMAFTQA
jgi:hypothetical protein